MERDDLEGLSFTSVREMAAPPGYSARNRLCA